MYLSSNPSNWDIVCNIGFLFSKLARDYMEIVVMLPFLSIYTVLSYVTVDDLHHTKIDHS